MALGVTRRSSYRYKGVDRGGTVVSGTIGATSADAVRRELARRAVTPISVRSSPTWLLQPGARVARQELAAVFRNVASLTRAGMPIERALAASEPLVKDRVAGVLADVRRAIREGALVAEALGRFPEVFPAVVVGTVSAGERGSRLDAALTSVADQLERDAQLRAEVRSALAYPALILFVGVLSILVMGVVVIPRFAAVLSDLGAELPTSTQILLGLGVLLRRYGLLVLLALLVLAASIPSVLGRDNVRAVVDRVALRVPVLGPILHGFASARVCRGLGAMVGAGLPLVAALSASREAAGNAEVARRLRLAASLVTEGQSLSRSLERHQALVPHALQLVAVGETSAQLSEMASRAGDLAADRAERSLRATTSLLEPALVIVLGFFVALIAASLLQAVYAVRPGL